jgi:Zn-finger nucleic acid-binding protein
MLIVEFEEIELDVCPDCQGLWFDAQELCELFELVGAPEQVHSLEGELRRLTQSSSRRTCPRCRGRLMEVAAPTDAQLILDQCPRGHGLWFDHGELETLFASVLGEESDALADVRKYLGGFAAAHESGDAES